MEIGSGNGKAGFTVQLSPGLVGKLALAVIGGVLFGLLIRAGARWLMRLLVLIGLLAAIYIGAQALGLLGR